MSSHKKKCWREGSSTHIFTPTWLTLSPTNIWCTNEHDSSLQLRRYALFLQSIHNKQHNCFSIRHIDLRLIDTLRTYFFLNNSGVYIVHFYYSRAWGRAKRTFFEICNLNRCVFNGDEDTALFTLDPAQLKKKNPAPDPTLIRNEEKKYLNFM